jgi:hypothetical protein
VVGVAADDAEASQAGPTGDPDEDPIAPEEEVEPECRRQERRSHVLGLDEGGSNQSQLAVAVRFQRRRQQRLERVGRHGVGDHQAVAEMRRDGERMASKSVQH